MSKDKNFTDIPFSDKAGGWVKTMQNLDIQDGKDAAVSYKSADLKFRNNLDYDIKLRANVKNNKVVIKLEKV